MIGLIIGILFIVVPTILVFIFSGHFRMSNSIFGFIILSFFSCLFTFTFFIPSTGGLYQNYGVVKQIGYLTNFSKTGVIYKTYEGELQKGVGEQATVEKPFRFSLVDKSLARKLNKYLGATQRIQLTCKQWLCMPFKIGDTDKQVIDVKEIN